MRKQKLFGMVAVVCTIMLVMTTLQVSATKIERTPTVEELLANADSFNFTMKNSTKQILRILLFIGILGVALNPDLHMNKYTLLISLMTGKMHKPLNIRLNAKLMLLALDCIVLVKILQNKGALKPKA